MLCRMNGTLGRGMNEWTSSVGSLRPGSWKGVGWGRRELGQSRARPLCPSWFFFPAAWEAKEPLPTKVSMWCLLGANRSICLRRWQQAVGVELGEQGCPHCVPGHACQMGRYPGSAGPEKIQLMEAQLIWPWRPPHSLVLRHGRNGGPHLT